MMSKLELTPAEMEAAIRRFGVNTGGGFVDQHAREYLIRNIGLTNRLEDLRNLVVATRQGHSILLRQVAQVEFAPRVKRGDAGFMGAPAVIIGIQKQPTADTVSLTRLIEAQLQSIQKTLPQGVTADKIQFRQATFIETSIASVERVLVEAALVVTVVLFLFLMNVRATAISLTAIPISILITVLVFKAFGLSINTMTLGGLAIAIGALVDDAVVGVENILRRLKENRERQTPLPILDVIARASQEVRSGIFYATVIIILVFVPLFALSGIEGRLFAPLGIAYIVSTLASLLTSITVTPVLASYFLAAPRGTGAGTAFWYARLRPVTPSCCIGHSGVRERCLLQLRSVCWPLGSAPTCCRARSCRRSTKEPFWSAFSTTPASRSRVQPAGRDCRTADHDHSGGEEPRPAHRPCRAR